MKLNPTSAVTLGMAQVATSLKRRKVSRTVLSALVDEFSVFAPGFEVQERAGQVDLGVATLAHYWGAGLSEDETLDAWNDVTKPLRAEGEGVAEALKLLRETLPNAPFHATDLCEALAQYLRLCSHFQGELRCKRDFIHLVFGHRIIGFDSNWLQFSDSNRRLSLADGFRPYLALRNPSTERVLLDNGLSSVVLHVNKHAPDLSRPIVLLATLAAMLGDARLVTSHFDMKPLKFTRPLYSDRWQRALDVTYSRTVTASKDLHVVLAGAMDTKVLVGLLGDPGQASKPYPEATRAAHRTAIFNQFEVITSAVKNELRSK